MAALLESPHFAPVIACALVCLFLLADFCGMGDE